MVLVIFRLGLILGGNYKKEVGSSCRANILESRNHPGIHKMVAIMQLAAKETDTASYMGKQVLLHKYLFLDNVLFFFF